MYATVKRAGFLGHKGLVIRIHDGAVLREYSDYRHAESVARHFNAVTYASQRVTAATNDQVWAGRR